ncbi:MAG: hypothetical protein H7338_17370 [Candidatus Sericytochromatia bacterium]|nr:hypothetical protein [Candidatus Sericytochromatia bacterium]
MRHSSWILLLTLFATTSACALAPVVSGSAAGGAGLPTTAANAVSMVQTDDRDIAPPAANRAQVGAALQTEGQKVGDMLEFRLVAKQAVRSRGDRATGKLHAFDPKGVVKPLARVSYDVQNGGASGTKLTGADGSFDVPADAGKIVFTLANNHWSLTGKSGSYAWTLPITGGGDLGVVTPEKGSANGQAAWIHMLFVQAENKLQGYGVGLDWWKTSIRTTWPGSGDYYQGNSLNLTGAHQWDVNGHELGHALSDQAFNMRFGGGQHYIDRCYDPTIAWSEGVASFISAVISIDPADDDAKFEFMVPRRAPLRYETVPADVCEGQENEWRVGAACWDLFDTHGDGKDTVALPLPTIWKAWSKGNGAKAIGSLNDAYLLIGKAAPAQADAIKQVMAQNTMPFTVLAGKR